MGTEMDKELNLLETEEDEDLDFQDDDALELQDDTTVESADDTSAETTGTADDTAYTYHKQQADQERANAKRAREELASLNEAYDEQTDRLNQLEQELANIKTVKQQEENKLEDMDPDITDEKVIKNIKVMEQRLAAKEKQINEVLKEVEAQKKHLEAENEKERLRKVRLSVASTVESSLKKHGIAGAAKYRNEALAMADELVDSGQAKRPDTIGEGISLVEDCYLKIIKEKSSKNKKGSVSVDTGKAGTSPAGKKKSGIKPGSLDDVADQMLKDKSWLQSED